MVGAKAVWDILDYFEHFFSSRVELMNVYGGHKKNVDRKIT
jgi:hypothetical protein